MGDHFLPTKKKRANKTTKKRESGGWWARATVIKGKRTEATDGGKGQQRNPERRTNNAFIKKIALRATRKRESGGQEHRSMEARLVS